MKSACIENLSVRSEERGIFFVGSEAGKRLLSGEVKEGDQVLLKKNQSYIIVEKIKYEGSGFVGVITGFEPPASELEGLEVGEEILFFDHHIFTCEVFD